MKENDLISRGKIMEDAKELSGPYTGDGWDNWGVYALIERQPSIPAVPLEPLCKLLAEMYHCPGSGWPANNRVCHPSCPDEAFENLCGTDCDNHSDEERWKVFLLKWMERLNDMDCWR